MKPRPRAEEQDDLLRPRLTDMIDLRHELAKLAELIDWEFFEQEWAGFFPSSVGRPATSPRLIAGLLYLQHAFDLSDEAVVGRWVENPYYQHFCGEAFSGKRSPGPFPRRPSLPGRSAFGLTSEDELLERQIGDGLSWLQDEALLGISNV